MTSVTLKEIIEAFSRGDVSAFDEIYNRYVNVIFHFAYSLTKDNDLAQEITQEVFVKFWENRQKFYAINSPKSYLMTMIKNQLLNHYRDEALRKKHFEAVARDMETVDRGEDSNDAYALSDDYMRMAELAITLLPPKRRRIFEMSRKESKTYKQIAAELGLSKTVVKKQILLALKNIRDYSALNKEFGSMIFLLLFS